MTRHAEPFLLTLSVLLWTFAFGYDAGTEGSSRLSLGVKAAAELALVCWLAAYWVRRQRT